ncbi:MAG: ftsZ, partial [Roseomonas sp.]|nr:ftsZ [Roseomonas sp.]
RAAMPQQGGPGGPVRVGPMAGAPRRPAGMAHSVAPAPVPQHAQAGFAESQAAYAYEAPSPEDIPASIAAQQAESQPRTPPTAHRAASAPPPVSAPAPSGGGFSLFRKATGLMRRNLGAEGDTTPPAPQAPAAPRAAAPQPAPRPAQPDEMGGLDIPTFLRRQSN